MALYHLQGLLLFLQLVVVSECGDPYPVTATLQEDVGLPCLIPNLTSYRVKWTKDATDASQRKVLLVRPKTSKIQDAKRVTWKADEHEQMRLFLTKVQKSDEGVYSCEICRNWDCNIKNISLKVKDCKVLKPVKATPSTPVNLSCPVDTTSRQSGHQHISWKMLKGDNLFSVTSDSVVINGTSLVFQSVSHRDVGWYRCRPGETQRCFEIHLQVGNDAVTTTIPALTTSEIISKTTDEHSSSSSSSGTVIPVVVPLVIIGIIIMAALIGRFIGRRRRTTQQPRRHFSGLISLEVISNLKAV
uniref:uncharacterized protein n=1 Tax=Semicossyphus pulcher TaxID=241346 RepID=UPI0037E906C5